MGSSPRFSGADTVRRSPWFSAYDDVRWPLHVVGNGQGNGLHGVALKACKTNG